MNLDRLGHDMAVCDCYLLVVPDGAIGLGHI
jgi:hypothetical protein